MVAHEFYLNDSEGNKSLLGILPERRKDPNRITQKSILRWGRMLLYNTVDGRKVSHLPTTWWRLMDHEMFYGVH